MPNTWLITDPGLAERIWIIREVGATETQLSIDPGSPDASVGWEDAAVDPSRLATTCVNSATHRPLGCSTSLYGHFGDGCIHASTSSCARQGVATWRAFLRDAAGSS